MLSDDELKLLTALLTELDQELVGISVKFIKEKVAPHSNELVDRFTHVFPLIYYHSMSVTIAGWLQFSSQLETYKSRMALDLTKYLTEFRDKFDEVM